MNEPDDLRDETRGEEPHDPAFRRLLDKLHAEHNFDFREYKPTSLVRRIRTRMAQVRADSYDAYSTYLDRHPDEHTALFNTILINVTGFFRDPDAWKVMSDEVIPRVVHEATEAQALRVWTAGCSSGEESYSVAMLIAEHLGDRARDFNVKIYATDIDDEALHVARQGLYRVEDVKDVSSDFLEKYFVREGQAYRFRREYRRWCIFGRHNVFQDPPLSHVDLLTCRNVLIYFTVDLQERILARFHYAVREGGILFLGRAESLMARSRWFTPMHVKWRIFQRTTTPAAPVPGPSVRNRVDVPRAVPAADATSTASRLHRVVDALPAAVILVDPIDTIVVWNAAAETLFDTPAANAIGRKFRDLDISYRIEGLRARLEDVKTSHIPTRMEHVSFTRRTGDTVFADFVLIPVMDGVRVTAVVVHAADATETARLRDQMTRLAEQHATAIEELQSTNEELETTNEELQSTNEELETTVEELQAANAELATLNTELERRSGDLRRLDEYQHAVLANLSQAVLVLDREGIVKTWNQPAEELWGLRAEHVLGRPFWSLPVGDVAQRIRESLRRVLDTGTVESARDVPFMLPSGETRRLTLEVSPMKMPSGEVAGVLGVVTLRTPRRAD